MSPETIVILIVSALALAVVAWLLPRLHKQDAYERLEVEALPEDLKKRLPASLHPVIDPNICMGSGACVSACPEGKIIRIYDGHAHLVEPEACIGHGACARECPVSAITLVFGSAERGIDIPHVTETFETNVKGIFIAGELGGMGLIRNAVAQGVQAVRYIVRKVGRSKDPGVLDLLVVGAGPAGLAGALVAQEKGLRFAVIDQEESLGGTIAHYPRNKLVLSGPFDLPYFGRVKKRELLKEELMDIWDQVVVKAELRVRTGVRMDGLARTGDHISVATSAGELKAKAVLLAIGRRGTPRTLGVPGEELPKVTYSLREADAWEGQRLLVVGGGDSALEAATSLAEVPGTTVTLSYRGDTIYRAKPKNIKRFEAAVASGALTAHLKSTVATIDSAAVVLTLQDGQSLTLENDQVFIFAGGILPTKLLDKAGVAMERKFGTR